MNSAKRWLFVGGLLTTLNLAWLVAGNLDAAPSDVKGSGNVAVASYTTSKGSYILWSSGRITNAETGAAVDTSYVPAQDFQKAPPEGKVPTGSPNVAVHYIQNSKGTFTLFADGSVKKAADEGASAPAGGSAKIKFATTMPGAEPVTEGITLGNPRASHLFDENFSEGGIVLCPVTNSVGAPDMERKIVAYNVGPDGRGMHAGGGYLGLPPGKIWDGSWLIAVGK